MKLEPLIQYSAEAVDRLRLVLDVAREYREADAPMKLVLLKAVQCFAAPPLVAREEPDEPKAVEVRAEFGKAMVEVGAPMLTKAMDEKLLEDFPPIPATLDRRGKP